MTAGVAVILSGLASAKEPVQPVLESAGVGDAAVSQINGKLEGSYGRVADSYSRGVSASLSVPVGQHFGFQGDALYAHANDDDFYGLGGHFFTRKPDQWLLGVVVGGVYSGAVESYLAAVEAEYYFDKVTLGGYAGYNNVQTDVIFPTFNPDLRSREHFAVVNVYASIYPMEDLMVRLQYSNRVERNFYSLQIEYQLPAAGWALFVDGGVGDNDYRHLMGGVRYYFGAKKSLKSRHRHDDPPNVLTGLHTGSMAAAGNPSGAPPAGTPGGGGGGPIPSSH